MSVPAPWPYEEDSGITFPTGTIIHIVINKVK
jgi:hypothetical protein